jgi:hypothetical protein
MLAHIIHDDRGTIKSVIFQGTEVQGDLEIQSEGKGDLVTVVDLTEVYPERAVDAV